VHPPEVTTVAAEEQTGDITEGPGLYRDYGRYHSIILSGAVRI